MMLDRYLWTQLVWAIVLAMMAMLAVLSLVDFMNELDNVDASYTLASVIRYIGLTTAGRIYETLPAAVLIGSLLSLGNLAAQSELTALRAIGYSAGRICLSVIGLGCFFAVVVLLIGELLIPSNEVAASKIRNDETRAGVFHTAGSGTWLREGNYFIHAATIDNNGIYHDVSIYELGSDRYLQHVITGASLEAGNKQLLLRDARKAFIDEDRVTLQHFPYLTLERAVELEEEAFGVAAPEAMSMAALIRHIDFLKLSSLRYDFHELALWSKFSQPLSVLVMLLLALPYAFSPMRSNVGQRLFHGILIGLAYALLDKNLGNLAIVLALPPAWGAFAPLLLGSTFGLYRLKSLQRSL